MQKPDSADCLPSGVYCRCICVRGRCCGIKECCRKGLSEIHPKGSCPWIKAWSIRQILSYVQAIGDLCQASLSWRNCRLTYTQYWIQSPFVFSMVWVYDWISLMVCMWFDDSALISASVRVIHIGVRVPFFGWIVAISISSCSTQGASHLMTVSSEVVKDGLMKEGACGLRWGTQLYL